MESDMSEKRINNKGIIGVIVAAVFALSAMGAFIDYGVDANIPNVQTTNYQIAPSDCTKTVKMGTGATGFLTVTIPVITNFPSNCSVKIVNGDSANGKAVSGLTGIPGNMLWPGQAATLKIVSGAWAWTEKPGRWVLTSDVTFNVDPVNGCEAATVPICDGLGTGVGAFQKVQTVVNAFLNQIDVAGFSGGALLADGTYTEQVSCTGKFVGTTEIRISGASGHTTSVLWNVTATGGFTGFAIKDYCALGLDNMTISGANGTIGIQTTLFGNVDFSPGLTFGSFGAAGTAIYIASSGYGSAVSGFAINGGANQFLLVQGGVWNWGNATIPGASSLSFNTAFQVEQDNAQVYIGSATFPGFSGISGYKFKLTTGSVLASGGVDPNTILPGSTNGLVNQSTLDGSNHQASRFAIVLSGVDFGTANKTILIPVNLPFGSNYQIGRVVLSGANGDLSAATVCLSSAAACGGTQYIASATAVTVSTASAGTSNNMQNFTLANVGNSETINIQTLFFEVQSAAPEGRAGTLTLEILPVS